MPGAGRKTVAFVSTWEVGHFARLRSLIAGVVACGWEAAVFTDARFRAEVEACGGTFFDLYGRIPLDAIDDESRPRSCRQVSYAGWRANEVAEALGAVRPSLLVYDSFSVVARIAAGILDLPHVCVCSGHNLRPDRFRERIHRDVDVRIAPRCAEAVERLRDRYGMEDASPFSYMSTRSPHLNLYCEPEEYIDPDVRETLEPLAFLGSLPPGLRVSREPAAHARLRTVYVSFGTVIWRFYAAEAIAALRAIAAVLGRRGDLRVVISLGGYGGDLPDLASTSVRVVPYVDQLRMLRESDLFVTHHGLNSTHEAAYLRVPMLSYPFFWDQPELAAKCAELGISVPLAGRERAPLGEGDVERALGEAEGRLEALRERLAIAARWEERVLAGREALIRRVLGLAAG